MVKQFIKGNKIALAVTMVLLIIIIVFFTISRTWYAWIKSDEIILYAKSHDIPTRFNGLLVSREEIMKSEKCYEIFFELLLKDPLIEKKESSSNLLQEYINFLLVEADIFNKNNVTNEQIELEANSLLNIVIEQAERKNIDLQEQYNKHQIIQDDLFTCLKKQAVLRIAKSMIYNEKKVSDTEALTYYQENQEQYITPPKVEVVIITLNNLEDAKKVWKAIDSGNEFYDVLVKYDKEFSLVKNTQKIWVKTGQLDAELEKAIFDMEVGEKRGIVTTSQGYHIIKVENVVKSQLLEFEAIKDIVKADIKELYVISKWKEYITQLRAETNIVVWR